MCRFADLNPRSAIGESCTTLPAVSHRTRPPAPCRAHATAAPTTRKLPSRRGAKERAWLPLWTTLFPDTQALRARTVDIRSGICSQRRGTALVCSEDPGQMPCSLPHRPVRSGRATLSRRLIPCIRSCSGAGAKLYANSRSCPDDSPLGAAAVDRAESKIEPGIH